MDEVVVPQGFDISLLEIMACPENLTGLRLARQSEIKAINVRIRDGALRRWDEKIINQPLEAVLVREDGKIAYEVRAGIPIMLIEEALVLDSTVGKPDPEKARNRK
jgi:uncharacterized protein YbaR (Trm112 family)